jgi:hypothetical protein
MGAEYEAGNRALLLGAKEVSIWMPGAPISGATCAAPCRNMTYGEGEAPPVIETRPKQPAQVRRLHGPPGPDPRKGQMEDYLMASVQGQA